MLAVIYQYLNKDDLMKDFSMINEVDYNVQSYYGNIYGNLAIVSSGLDSRIQKIFSSLKPELLPIDLKEFLDVCVPEEGQSALDYLVSYMEIKGYSYLNEETGYDLNYSETDIRVLVEEVISQCSTDEYKEIIGNIEDCYVFYKEIDGYEFFCIVLATDKIIENSLISGVNITVGYGHVNVIRDMYGAMEAWKSCQ